jgi:hypothetical protein
MAKRAKSTTETYVPQHRWAALFLKFDDPGETQLIEWCVQCGKLKLKRWESKSRAGRSQRPRYYVPNSDYAYGEGSSHNSWGRREPPPCRKVALRAR